MYKVINHSLFNFYLSFNVGLSEIENYAKSTFFYTFISLRVNFISYVHPKSYVPYSSNTYYYEHVKSK